jgi:hypothetical protein
MADPNSCGFCGRRNALVLSDGVVSGCWLFSCAIAEVAAASAAAAAADHMRLEPSRKAAATIDFSFVVSPLAENAVYPNPLNAGLAAQTL